MLCPYCGTQNPAGEKICMGCKEPLPEVDGSVSWETKKEEETATEDGKKKKKSGRVKKEKKKMNRKLLGILLAVILLAIIGGALFMILRNKNHNVEPRSPIDNMETLLNDYSLNLTDYSKQLMPEPIYKNLKVIYSVMDGVKEEPEIILRQKKELNDVLESYKDYYGDDVKISIDIIGRDKIDAVELSEMKSFYANLFTEYISKENLTEEQLANKLKDTYDLSAKNAEKAADNMIDIHKYGLDMEITEGYDYVLRLRLNGRQKQGTALMDVYVIKVDGTWSIDIHKTYQKFHEDALRAPMK